MLTFNLLSDSRRDAINAWNRAYYAKNGEKLRARRRAFYAGNIAVERTAALERYRNGNLHHVLLRQAKSHSYPLGRECTITVDDIRIPESCPCCGVLLVRAKGARNKCSPTLDRVDSSQGYVRGNVAVICFECNRLKSNATEAQLTLIINYMKAHEVSRV